MNIAIIKNGLVAVACMVSMAAAAQKKEAYDMIVDGVKVIVQPVDNEIVQVQAIIKGGVQNYPLSKAGIESLAMTALTECGTKNDDKNSFKNKLDKVSCQMYGYTGMDYATLSFNCIKEDLNTVWPLFTDALTTPRFDAKEFDRIKQDALNGIKQQESQPDAAISNMAKKTAFAGKNYAKNPTGTEASVKSLTASETKSYFQSIATRSRMIIVIVADLDKNDIEQKVHSLLQNVPQGSPFMQKKESFTPQTNTFKSEKRDLATNYIQGVTAGPAPGTPDYNAFVLAMRIFYDRHFLEVRTNNGLSYAPYTYFDGGTTPSGNIVVSTTNPNKYIDVLKKLVEKTKNGFTDEEVKNMKTSYITRQYYKEETNDAQAGSLASNEVLHNNWRRAITLNDDLKNVTAKDVSAAFNKYITKMNWVYQGDPSKVNPALFTKSETTPKLPQAKFSGKKAN